MRGRQLGDIPVDRLALRNIAISEIILDSGRIESPLELGADEQRLQLRCEEQPTIVEHGVIERLLAEAVAGEKQRLFPLVPQRKGKHAAEALQTIRAPFLPGVNDDLGIRMGAEAMSPVRQLCRKGLEIVDLAIERDDNGVVLVEQRLLAPGDADDGEPAMAETDGARQMEAAAVRTAMGDAVPQA